MAQAPAVAKNESTEAHRGLPVPEDVPIALLVDVSSGQVLYSKNADRRFVPASITKAMTTFVAFELMDDGKLRQNQTMTISDATWREWNGKGSTMWLGAGFPVRVEDLLIGIANISANDASVVLAEGAAGSIEEWTALMNAEARELGMTQSNFATPNGWPDEGYTFTTAKDLIKLAEAMVTRHPQKFANYVGRRTFSWNGVTQTNYDPLLGRVRGADGIKTGFTNESGFGFLGTAQRGGQRLVMVVGGAERLGLRARVSRALMEWGFSAFDREQIFPMGAVIAQARVQGGDSRSLDLKTDQTISVNVPRGQETDMSLSVHYDGPIRAPIVTGQKVAVLEVRIPGMEAARIPLVAATDIEEAGIIRRTINGIAGWFS